MTPLERKALGTIPLTYACVESFYDDSHAGSVSQCLKVLCLSHERMRMELEGAEVLREDAEREIAVLKSRVEELEQALRYAARCSTLMMVEDTARGMGVIS